MQMKKKLAVMRKKGPAKLAKKPKTPGLEAFSMKVRTPGPDGRY